MHQRQSSASKHTEWYSQKYKEQKKMQNETYLVQSLKDGVYFISKKINISRYSPIEIQQLEKQIDQIRRLSHPNIVRLKETFREKDNIFQIIDYVGSQTLRSRLKSHHEPNSRVSTQYLLQLLLALDYLDNQKFTIIPAIDIESIYLNKFGSLRLSFTFDRKKTDSVEEVKRIGEMFGTIKVDENNELKQIQRMLLYQTPTPQELLNHPYLIKAMHDFYKKSLDSDGKPKMSLPPKTNIKEVPVINENIIKELPAKEKAIQSRPKSHAEQTTKIQKSQKKISDPKELNIRQRNNSHQNIQKDRTETITKKTSLEKLKKLEPEVQMKQNEQTNVQFKIKQTNLLPKIIVKNAIPLSNLKSPNKDIKKSPESPNFPNLQLHQRSTSQKECQDQCEQNTVTVKDQLISTTEFQAGSDVFDLSCTHPMSKILNSLEFKNMLKSEQKERDEQGDISVDITIDEVYSDEDIEDRDIQRDTNQFCRTSRKQELQELMIIYKSQLMQSASKQMGNCFLNMSEIREESVENSTFGQSTFCEK